MIKCKNCDLYSEYIHMNNENNTYNIIRSCMVCEKIGNNNCSFFTPRIETKKKVIEGNCNDI